MTRIISGLLNDTLNLVQLARETALARGKSAQAQRLSPVADELKTLAKTQNAPQNASISSTMQQNDFRTLLSAAGGAVPTTPAVQTDPSAHTMAANDRNRVVLAMASAKTPGIDIARQLGMTLDEVNMVMSANQKSRTVVGAQK
jgi:hypothetical protein